MLHVRIWPSCKFSFLFFRILFYAFSFILSLCQWFTLYFMAVLYSYSSFSFSFRAKRNKSQLVGCCQFTSKALIYIYRFHQRIFHEIPLNLLPWILCLFYQLPWLPSFETEPFVLITSHYSAADKFNHWRHSNLVCYPDLLPDYKFILLEWVAGFARNI